MVDKKDQDYPFIKETIKERPIDKRQCSAGWQWLHPVELYSEFVQL